MNKKSEFSISYDEKYFNSALTQQLRRYVDDRKKELNLKQDDSNIIKKEISVKTGIPLWKVKKIYAGTATLNLNDGKELYQLTQLLNCNIWALMGITADGKEDELNSIGLTEEAKLVCQKHNHNLIKNNIFLDSFLQLLNYMICQQNFINDISIESFEIINAIRNNLPRNKNQDDYHILYEKLVEKFDDKITLLYKHTETKSKELLKKFLEDKIKE